MNQHNHEHHGHDHGHHRPKRGLHKDWRTWLVVGLMLAAMAAYVLTMDESLQPGGQQAAPVPAAP